jgi:phosphoribosylaminoimidazolecarboxamide formyltransferase/IMP cyclohydrolase
VNLYPFVRTAARADVAFDDLVEQIDIGGPSLVRAAAKNFRDVIVVVSPEDYGRVIEHLDQPGPSPAEFRFLLARKAFGHTAEYDAAIATELERVRFSDGVFERALAPPGLPARLFVPATKASDLRYGENPHQAGAWYRTSDSGRFDVLQGKALSFTNLLDIDSAARISCEFDEPAAVVIKHTNPCGAAIGATVAEAYVLARDARLSVPGFQVCLFKRRGMWNTCRYSLGLLLSRMRAFRDVEILPAERVSISGPDVPLQVDGDPGGFLPAEISIDREPLSLVVG